VRYAAYLGAGDGICCREEMPMSRKLCRAIPALLGLVFLLSAMGCTTSPASIDVPEDDIFNVYIPPDMEYRGYNFRLKEGATFSLDRSSAISVIWIELRWFHAPTLDDIRAAVAPEYIEVIEPNEIMPFPFPPSANERLHDRQRTISIIAGGVVLSSVLLVVYILIKNRKARGGYTDE